MKILLDTNVLLRISEPDHPHHPPCVSALRTLATAGHTFCIASQTISEFLAVATRSVADRGLEMDQAKADAELTKVTSSLETLYDTKAVVDELRRLVVLYSVSGKSVHDTRLVAAMNVNAVSHLLTINTRDFNRFAEINVLDPRALIIPA
jgi:predicted nucleic acid-binding protein